VELCPTLPDVPAWKVWLGWLLGQLFARRNAWLERALLAALEQLVQTSLNPWLATHAGLTIEKVELLDTFPQTRQITVKLTFQQTH